MRNLTLRTTLLVLLLIKYTPAYTQPPHTFTRYTTEDGIAQKTVNSMLQDHKGNIWFATWDGINKFDGYTFKNYKAYPGDLTGLTNNRIDYITEDKYGYIWLQNYDNQVYRFNPRNGQFQPIPYGKYQAKQLYVLPSGNVWITTEYEGLIHIKTNPEDHTLIAENFSQINHTPIIETVHFITEDTTQCQWILTSNGIYQLTAESRNPVTFFVENLHNREQKQPFYDLLERENEILFTSHHGRIWSYQKKGGRFTLLELPTSSHITSIRSLSEDRLILGTNNDGFMVHDLSSQQTRHYHTSTTRALRSNHIVALFVDSYQEVWIQLDKLGITHFSPNTEEITYHTITDKYGKQINTQQGCFILEDIYKNLWVHPAGGGFTYYDRTTQKLIPFFDKKQQANWNLYNRMTVAFSDKQGNLWLSTSNNGLEKVTFNYNAFTLHSPNPNDMESLDNETRAVFEDSNGLLWVGSKDGVIRIYDNSMQFIGYLTSSGHISQTTKEALGMAYTFTEDHKGTLWIGTKFDGLISATPAPHHTYTLKRYKHQTNDIYSLSDNNIYSLYEDSKERLWIATFGGGLNYLDYNKSGEAIFINHRNHLKNYPINECYRTRFITSDYEENIWVGTTTGILSFKNDFTDPEKISFNHYTRIPGDIHSLSNNDVHSIHLTRKNELYVATFGGGLNKLLTFTKEKATFQSYTVQNGLPSDILLSIEEDTKGNLWMATEEEICKFTPETHTVENYTSKFFPAEIKFNEGTATRTKSGNMVLNTNKGILSFNPDSIHKSSYVPQIVFSQLQLGDKVIQPGKDNKVLQVDIDDTRSLTLSHKQNAFTIQYAALDMKYPEDIEYAYKLEGFEKEWNEVGRRRIATYTNLNKGEYTFNVKSTNGDGVWTENPRSISIRVLPSFWETPWAILLYVSGLILVVFIAAYILFTIYRLKNEVTIEQKISEIKLRFFTNISHELRTPLTLIAGPVEHILKHSTLDNETHEQLLLVEKNTNRMLRLINQILDFRKIQNKKMKMRVQQIDVIPFVRHLMENFYAIADEQQIEFLLESKHTTLTLWADADKLEKMLFNLLSNAFKYTPQGKKISVVIAEKEEGISISVQDEGIGIAIHKQKNLFVRFENMVDKNVFNQPTSGIGLSLVKELVEMHKGTVSMNSKPGEGSNFTIVLPKGKAHFDTGTEFILTDDVVEDYAAKEWETPLTETSEEDNTNIEKESLLLVEDNKELRFFLHTIFAPHFHIIEAENGRDGLTKAKEAVPDIIISDLMMPEMDGIEMMKELRNNLETSHIPIILLTAKSNIESKIEGMELGADDYITKPFSAAYLKARVVNLMEQRKKLQALYCASLTTTKQKEESNSYGLPIPALAASDQKFINQLIVLMEENIDNSELMVEDLALSLSMSRSVFFKKLKSLIGLSPVEFIKEIRIKRAAELVEEDEHNIAQIAYMVGFNDPHYFSKCFKQVFSMTPTEYKESKRKKQA